MLEQEYYKLVCETDAAWEEYCRYPNDNTWGNYVVAKQAEKSAQTSGCSRGSGLAQWRRTNRKSNIKWPRLNRRGARRTSARRKIWN